MPRHDGFPTNTEMLADFNAAARDVFVAAYERQLESKLPPAYEDKPLGLFYLQLWRDGSTAALEAGSSAIAHESAIVQTVSEHDASAMPDLLGWRDHSDEALEHYRETARRLGSIVLHDDLRLGRVLTTTGTNADYTVQLASGRVRHVSTFKEKPAKQSIAAGKFFMDEAAAYVLSDSFNKTRSLRSLEYVLGLADSDPDEQLQHAFQFHLTSTLPLNGHEGTPFLRKYQERMIQRSERIKLRIERLQNTSHGLETIIDREKAGLSAVNAALRRVGDLLDSRPL